MIAVAVVVRGVATAQKDCGVASGILDLCVAGIPQCDLSTTEADYPPGCIEPADICAVLILDPKSYIPTSTVNNGNVGVGVDKRAAGAIDRAGAARLVEVVAGEHNRAWGIIAEVNTRAPGFGVDDDIRAVGANARRRGTDIGRAEGQNARAAAVQNVDLGAARGDAKPDAVAAVVPQPSDP